MSWRQVFCVLKMNKVFATITGYLSAREPAPACIKPQSLENKLITHQNVGLRISTRYHSQRLCDRGHSPGAKHVGQACCLFELTLMGPLSTMSSAHFSSN